MIHLHEQDPFHRLIQPLLRDGAVFDGFHKPIIGLLHVFVLMAYEQDITARLNGLNSQIAEGIVFREGAHVHIIGNDDAVIAHVLAKPIGDDFS